MSSLLNFSTELTAGVGHNRCAELVEKQLVLECTVPDIICLVKYFLEERRASLHQDCLQRPIKEIICVVLIKCEPMILSCLVQQKVYKKVTRIVFESE